MENTEQNNNIHAKLNAIQSEINALQLKIENIKNELNANSIKNTNDEKRVQAEALNVLPKQPVNPVIPPTIKQRSVISPAKKSSFQLENFIGKNLLSIFGIAITVIGIGIGVKYAIDNELINPLTRIILGYILGVLIAVTALKLKTKYTYFSAVLLSGAMASFYFVTFAAYSFYDLFPQIFAFVLMVVFTVFTVYASINYNIQIIAHLALVGAYAVPFLLSDGSGKVVVLFSYMAITNIGILVLAFLRNWKILNFTASFLTWVIVATWYVSEYISDYHLPVILGFSTLFFFLFYTAVLAFKIKRSEKISVWDTLVIILNSFFYFAVVIAAFNSSLDGKWNGMFCLANAVLHFAITLFIYKKNLADKKLFYLTAALVLTFLTITFPVQLDGSWVTIAWMCEAVVLFYIGRSQQVIYYEVLSYIVAFVGLIGLAHDWVSFYESYHYYAYSFSENISYPKAFLNVQFLSSILVCAAWYFLRYINNNKKFEISGTIKGMQNVLHYVFSSLFFLLLYYSFYYEIDLYWKLEFLASGIDINGYIEYDYTYKNIGSAWMYAFTGIYLSISGFINATFLKHKITGIIIWALMIIYTLSFITDGLYNLSYLLNEYLSENSIHFNNIFLVFVRYISIAAMIMILFAKIKNRYIAFPNLMEKYSYTFSLFTHLVILTLLSSELKTIMKLTTGTYPLTVSILWGLYALMLVVYGLKRNIKINRIAGFVLFFASLCKILILDIRVSSTIGKTIVFISLGILLLVTSFIYQKLNKTINENDKQ